MDYTERSLMGTRRRIPVQNLKCLLNDRDCEDSRVFSVAEPRNNAKDMNFKIHSLETEAYGSVLRAFNAQSNLLTWDKERLLTQLRKELNITNTEHGELLQKIDSDDSVKVIREWRNRALYVRDSLSVKINTCDFDHNTTGIASQKGTNASHTAFSKSLKYESHGQPYSTNIISQLPSQAREDKQSYENAMISHLSAGQAVKSMKHENLASLGRKGEGKWGPLPKKGFQAPESSAFRKRSDLIEIRATDKLIHQVERAIYGRESPHPLLVEKAKLLLREHEGALIEAVSKLADVSDGDSSPEHIRRHELQGELLGSGQERVALNDFFQQSDRRSGHLQGGRIHSHPVGGSTACNEMRKFEDIHESLC